MFLQVSEEAANFSSPPANSIVFSQLVYHGL